jgi:Na+-transporting NADH:ubiquinone oxidoreductase subunit E
MNLMAPMVIFSSSLLTQNILLAGFLGMCSFLACSRSLETSAGLGIAVTFVMTCTTALNYLLYHYILVPLGLEYLAYILFIAVIAAFVQLVEMIIERLSPTLYHALGIFLPLITVNCAILGASLFMVVRGYNGVESVAFGFGGGLGFLLAIVLMAGLREKMGYSDVPMPLRGTAILMLITGVIAMTVMGFAGMIKTG